MKTGGVERRNRLRPIAIVSSLCSLCLCGETASGQDEWWRGAVFYEVFVRSFADSKEGALANDGVGDLRGLIERLDYLNDGDPGTESDLGVTALWLMPISESPSYHGYDVVDYRRVDEEYGSNEDFLALIEAAHARGMRVIVDAVINHTSSTHPWFVESGEPGSAKRDWYVWSDEPRPVEWGSRVWHRRGERGPYYFGLFWQGMPDLNLRNADATAAVHGLSRFWLTEMRADGFRLDAAKHLIEEWPRVENTKETVRWLEAYREEIKRAAPEAFLVGEVWSSAEQIARYIPGALDAAFEFDLAFAIVEGVRDGDAARIARAIAAAQSAYPPGQYATFLANHDMQRVMTTMRAGSADDAEALAKTKLAATIQLTLPGIPFIYYGEEIGMTGAKPDPDIRTPMQWAADAGSAGFTGAKPWRSPHTDLTMANVGTQLDDPGSLLSHYRGLIRQRLAHSGISAGAVRLLHASEPAVLAFMYEADGGHTIFTANCSGARADRVSLAPGADAEPLADVSLGPWGSATAFVSD